jgi:hypothetical protein
MVFEARRELTSKGFDCTFPRLHFDEVERMEEGKNFSTECFFLDIIRIESYEVLEMFCVEE